MLFVSCRAEQQTLQQNGIGRFLGAAKFTAASASAARLKQRSNTVAVGREVGVSGCGLRSPFDTEIIAHSHVASGSSGRQRRNSRMLCYASQNSSTDMLSGAVKASSCLFQPAVNCALLRRGCFSLGLRGAEYLLSSGWLIHMYAYIRAYV